jgi:hypothetical protein
MQNEPQRGEIFVEQGSLFDMAPEQNPSKRKEANTGATETNGSKRKDENHQLKK